MAVTHSIVVASSPASVAVTARQQPVVSARPSTSCRVSGVTSGPLLRCGRGTVATCAQDSDKQQQQPSELEESLGLDDKIEPGAPPTSQASVEQQLNEVVSPPAGGAQPVPAGKAMAFSGPAPELINGRLAMIGMISAIGAELASGKTVVDQFSTAPGPILFAFLAITAASLAPLTAIGEKRKGFGPFTPSAEMINGRAAMLGFAALIGTELATKHALF